MSRAFSALDFGWTEPGVAPQAGMRRAFGALRYWRSRRFGPLTPSLIPDVFFIEGDMIFLEERAHLGLEVPLAVMRFLCVDVFNQRAGVGGADGEGAVSALPGEGRDTLSLHPFRRVCLYVLQQLSEVGGWMEADGEMDVVGRAVDPETVAFTVSDDCREIGMQFVADGLGQERAAAFGAEDDMNQHEAQGLGHAGNYKSRFQRSGFWAGLTWGCTPGWYESRLWRFAGAAVRVAAVAVLGAVVLMAGCKSSPVPVKPAVEASAGSAYHYPARPAVAAPGFKVFHQDEDTYTLVTKDNASDDEIAALIWEFRDAARGHSFDTLKLSEAFIDARKPTVWIHVYRGVKCANEKFTKGKYPCGAKYNGAGDYTLGGYNAPQWDDGVLHNADGTETHLWDPDAKQ